MVFRNAHFLRWFVSISLVIFGVSSPAIPQESADEPPVVIAGQMPLYPPIARAARVEGLVRIHITTDGSKAVSFKVESGPAMLVNFAKENIQTWEFFKHKPATFDTIFEYVIEEPAQCYYGNPSVKLDLPLHVRISAKGVKTCDPGAEQVKPSR